MRNAVEDITSVLLRLCSRSGRQLWSRSCSVLVIGFVVRNAVKDITSVLLRLCSRKTNIKRIAHNFVSLRQKSNVARRWRVWNSAFAGFFGKISQELSTRVYTACSIMRYAAAAISFSCDVYASKNRFGNKILYCFPLVLDPVKAFSKARFYAIDKLLHRQRRVIP